MKVYSQWSCLNKMWIWNTSSGPMMHQQPPSQQYNMPPGGGGQHYQGQQTPMGMMGQVNQGNHVMSQRPMPPYRPPQQGKCPCWFISLISNCSEMTKAGFWTLTFACPNPGPPQQYPGQEEYYGDQYSHGGQGAPEGAVTSFYNLLSPSFSLPNFCAWDIGQNLNLSENEKCLLVLIKIFSFFQIQSH